ncbi:MAG: flagellar protein FlaG [Lachnospiraceae bacterium]|nr:flagellar protein FlaG [Lachnospiraceae bacterium]
MVSGISSVNKETHNSQDSLQEMVKNNSKNKPLENVETAKAKKEETQSETPKKELQKPSSDKKDYWKREQNRIRKLKEAINQANQETKLKQTACEFSYNDETNRIAIKVKDRDTDEVIREIPAEETLKMLARIMEQAGLVMDERR